MNSTKRRSEIKGILRRFKIDIAENSAWSQSFVNIFHSALSSDPTNNPPNKIKPIPPCILFFAFIQK